ncbi:hypothetical protein B0I35DRAFT_241337 [Stachybotrys elegans]|uniref:Uncharacterized protein n=1 Tax=Stachybotrys elegans TaxID=80388 RepID=A0A8K0SM02_9HYPO|nr:hypothetical protein B0I35DRAFT_241337 [Stachybotrys elegans]
MNCIPTDGYHADHSSSEFYPAMSRPATVQSFPSLHPRWSSCSPHSHAQNHLNACWMGWRGVMDWCVRSGRCRLPRLNDTNPFLLSMLTHTFPKSLSFFQRTSPRRRPCFAIQLRRRKRGEGGKGPNLTEKVGGAASPSPRARASSREWDVSLSSLVPRRSQEGKKKHGSRLFPCIWLPVIALFLSASITHPSSHNNSIPTGVRAD